MDLLALRRDVLRTELGVPVAGLAIAAKAATGR
jgi:hypothetical protein